MKTLYVGLGGQGVKTLAAIKRKMDSYAQFAADRGQQVNYNDEFLFLDTDTKDIQEIPGADLYRDFVSLDTTPATLYHYERTHVSADSTRFFDWYDPVKTGLKASPLYIGADAIRMDGRLGLYANRNNFMNCLRQKMANLNGPAVDEYLRALPMNVYVFSGTSGGTGSGILLDVLMTIDKIYTGIVGNPNTTPSVTLFLFGPDQTYTIETDADAKMKKARNGAACLFELDAFKRCTIKHPLDNHHRSFNRFSGWVDGFQLTSPFHFPKYVFYIDNTLVGAGMTNAPTISYRVMHDIVADFVFNLEIWKLNKFNELSGADDVVGISFLDSLLWPCSSQNNIDQNGYCEMFCTFAPLSVCFPKDLFSRYCSTRFNVECFKAMRGNESVSNLNAKKAFKTALDAKMCELMDSIKCIFNNAEKSRKTVTGGICVNGTEQRIMYDNYDAPDFYKEMAPVVDQAKNEIKDWIYRHFAEMLQTVGVAGVIETVMECDAMLTALSTSLKSQITDIPQPRWLQTESSYFNEVLQCINKLIEIEIYDYCSCGNHGVLDHVAENLEALRDAFRFKVEDCVHKQGAYIGELNAENNNPVRHYLPRLDTIVNGSSFVEGNEFEKFYDTAFTEEFINSICQKVFADAQIQQEILDIVRSGERDKAAEVVCSVARKVDELFSQKFSNDQDIQNYAKTDILTRLTELENEGDYWYQNLLHNHEGALFPTNGAVLHNHGHERMVVGNFQNNPHIQQKYYRDYSVIVVDDAYSADRVVSYYVTNGLSIDDIDSLNATYLPQLMNHRSTHPAFIDKRFDIAPFTKDTIYNVIV